MMPVALKTLIWRLNVTKIQFKLITLSKIFFLSQIYYTDFPDRQKLKGHCYKNITIVQ